MGGMMLLLLALLALLFAVLVVTLRQPMRAALSLVSHMICLAAIYAYLGAHVVAVFQVLIYVGAVMVFMVYTIMLLDDRDDSFRHRFSGLTAPALALALGVVAELWLLVDAAPGKGRSTEPASQALFSFAAFSGEFMKRYWFHFELATVLLLVGVIAAWTAVQEGKNG